MLPDLLNKRKYAKNTHKGVTLIEVAIGVSILSLVVMMLIHSMALFLDTRGLVLRKEKALYLTEEGVEIMRYIRDENWNVLGTDLSVNTIYYLSVSSTTVATTTTQEIIDGFYYRQFELYDLYRDNTSDDIVASTTGSSYVDSDSKELVVRVGYDGGTTTLKTILTNIFDI